MANPIPYVPKTEFEAFHFGRGKSEGRTEGRTEGKTEAILRVLAARKVPTAEAERARILAERDQATLDRWLDRAVFVTSTSELLD